MPAEVRCGAGIITARSEIIIESQLERRPGKGPKRNVLGGETGFSWVIIAGLAKDVRPGRAARSRDLDTGHLTGGGAREAALELERSIGARKQARDQAQILGFRLRRQVSELKGERT